MSNLWYSARQIFTHLSPNARIMMLSEPFWALPMAWMGIYLPIYMRSLGMNERQIGWVTFATVLGQLCGITLAGWIADHWGRKKTLMTFDAICWGIPLILWSVVVYASRPDYVFLTAAFFWGFGMIVSPAWMCNFTESATKEQTQNAFSLLWLILSSNGIFAPVGGIMIKTMGTVPAIQWMMIISLITVSMGWTYRLINLHETLPNHLPQNCPANNPINVIKDHWIASKWGWDQPLSRILLFSGLLHGFYATLWNSFVPLYWTDPKGLGLSNSFVSLIPAVSSIATFLVILLVLPQLRKKNGIGVLMGGTLLVTLGMSMMLGSNIGFAGLIMGYAIFYAVGAGLFNPLRDTLWLLSLTRTDYRAKILAAVNLISLVINLPVGPLGGWLYQSHPAYPFIFCTILSITNLGLLITFFLNQRRILK